MANENADLVWSFGFRNHAGLYLSAESFGFRINCSSKVMRKKQIFFLEQSEGKTYFRTHMNRYLTFKADGRFMADAEAKGVDEEVYIETQADGRWAFRTARGYYIGGSGEAIDAFTKKLDADRLWTVQLAIHPQVVMRNVNRKRYVRLVGDKLNTDAEVPWGAEATLTLVYTEGKYALECDDGRFLSLSSDLKPVMDDSCKFQMEFYENNMVAFKGSNNKYLTAVGSVGTLKGSKDIGQGPSKDELFLFQDSEPQMKLKNVKWNKFASIKASIEIRCNPVEASYSEFFQFEINQDTKQWSLCTDKGMFWSCLPDGSIQAITPRANRGLREWFTVSWQGPRLTLTACNGKLVTVLPNGACYADQTKQMDENTFQFEIINRPKIVLRGEHGFIASLPSGTLECTKSQPEVFTMHVHAGICWLSGTNGKYWRINEEHDVGAVASEPESFTAEFVELSKLALRCKNGKLLQGQQNGSLAATGTVIDASTLWEY